MIHDGHTIMEFFKFGTDREDIAPFVSASYVHRGIFHLIKSGLHRTSVV